MVAGVDVLAFRPDDELRKLADAGDRPAGRRRARRAATPPTRCSTALGGTETAGPGSRPTTRPRTPGSTTSPSTASPTTRTPGCRTRRSRCRASPATPRSCAPERTSRGRSSGSARSATRSSTSTAPCSTDEEAAQFDELLGLARKVFPYIEEHNIYVEHWTHSVFWEKAWELADFLRRRRLHRAARRLLLPEPVRGRPGAVRRRRVLGHRRARARHEAVGRRDQAPPRHHGRAAGRPPPPAYGPPPEQVTDPFAIMNYGVTTERIQAWLGQGDDSIRLDQRHPRLAGGHRGAGPGAALGEGPRRPAARRGPRLPDHRTVLGVGVLRRRRRGHRHRRHDVPRRDRLPRVRPARPWSAPASRRPRCTTGQRVRVDGDQGVVTLLGRVTRGLHSTLRRALLPRRRRGRRQGSRPGRDDRRRPAGGARVHRLHRRLPGLPGAVRAAGRHRAALDGVSPAHPGAVDCRRADHRRGSRLGGDPCRRRRLRSPPATRRCARRSASPT